MDGRRTSTRQRRSVHEAAPLKAGELAAASSDDALENRKKTGNTASKTRNARERAELAKTTRALKSRLELALFKVGRGWEGVRFERIEAAHSAQHLAAGASSDTTSSSVDLGEDLLETSQASSSSRTSASLVAAAATTAPSGGSTANWLERSAGQQEQLNNSHNTARDEDEPFTDASQALLSPIKPSAANNPSATASSSSQTRQARSASTSSMQQQPPQSESVVAPKMASSSSAMPAFTMTSSSATNPPTTRPATTRPSLTASTSSLDCNPRVARPRSDSTSTSSVHAAPLSAPPTTTTFSSPIANTTNHQHHQEEFATPATASRISKRQRRDSHQQPKSSSSKRQHATIHEEEVSSPPPASASSSTSSSAAAVLNAAHLGHKRKISQNTLWHQSRAILSGIGGASSSALSQQSQSPSAANAFSATHPSPQAPYLSGQSAASLTSPVRLKPGQQKQQHGSTPGDPHSSPYGNLNTQQSPQAYMMSNNGNSVSPAGSSSGGTVRGGPSVQTPRRPSAQMMQNAPHTIAAVPSHHHHQYMPHHPSNLGLATSSSSSATLPSGHPQQQQQQQMQFTLDGTSTGMMQQLSHQGQLLQPQQQQALYAFQSPQTAQHQQQHQQQQAEYGYAVYNQQPHIMQTPQHAQSSSSHMMQHPHTAPQLHHSQQQQGMLSVNGYTNDYTSQNGMNVYSFGDPHSTAAVTAASQSQMSPFYPQQHMQAQQYGNQMSPLNMSNGFRGQQQQQQQQPMASQMGQTMSMQGLPSQQSQQQQQHLPNVTMIRSQSAISRAPSELSTFNGSQPPPLDPSLFNNSNNGSGSLTSSQESSSVDTNFSRQSAQAAQIVAAQMANGPGTRPGTATGPERETAAELMLYLAASPSPQQPSKKVGNTALGGGDLSQVKGRKLFGNDDAASQQQQQHRNAQMQQQQHQQQQQHRNSVSNHSQTSIGSGMNGEMSKSQSQMGMQQDNNNNNNNPFAVQHTYPGMNDQNSFAPQQMYTSSSSGSAEMQAAQLAQPFEYNQQAMQFDPYTMMTSQGVTLDQEFGSGW